MNENNPYLQQLDQIQGAGEKWANISAGASHFSAQAKTCNEAAVLIFPDPAKLTDAFLEYELPNLTHLSKLELLDLHDDFWALTLPDTVFVSDEGQFRQFDPRTGTYNIISEASLINNVLCNLNLVAKHFPSNLKYESFLNLKNRPRLKSVVERARDLCSVEKSFFTPKSPYLIPVQNGIINAITTEFTPHSQNNPVLHTLPVKYDPNARPECFLTWFLAHILDGADIEVLQQYSGQMLAGENHAQKILLLSGEGGWGRSTLMNILGSVIGWNRVGIIREEIYHDPKELGHLIGKHLLYLPDMPSQFLNHDESAIFKQLVGHDPLAAETKDGERFLISGTFPLVLTCNGKPQIKLDQDKDAWLRRLMVLEFKKPAHQHHIGKVAEMLLQKESAGILNWMLDGLAKLHKAGFQIKLNEAEEGRSAQLMLASESPAAFVQGCLVKKSDGVMGVMDLYAHYQNWCRKHHVQPFASREFTQIAKETIEFHLGLRYRHDLKIEIDGGCECVRGWKGLVLEEAEITQKTSVESDVQIKAE